MLTTSTKTRNEAMQDDEISNNKDHFVHNDQISK